MAVWVVRPVTIPQMNVVMVVLEEVEEVAGKTLNLTGIVPRSIKSYCIVTVSLLIIKKSLSNHLIDSFVSIFAADSYHILCKYYF